MTRVVTIDRARWWRGRGGNDSALLRQSDGSMCCLGFLALECGATCEEIRGVADINDLVHNLDRDLVYGGEGGPNHWRLPTGLVDFEDEDMAFVRRVHDTLVNVNDEDKIDDAHREAQIIALMATFGVTVVFVGEGHPIDADERARVQCIADADRAEKIRLS